MKAFSLLFLLPFSLAAQTLTLEDFKYPIPDILTKKLNKEELFSKMNVSLIKLNDSICSNRALMWAYDFKRKHEVESPKIFLFFTPKTSRHGNFNWWYHVSPMVNEKGKFWVTDRGFPRKIKTPLSVEAWLKQFTGEKSVCKEIKPGEDDLVERMFSASSFPEKTKYGRYDCYYKFVPPGYWTPEAVAKHLLGKDADGRPVQYVRDEINENEVYNACLEAVTAPWGWAMGAGQQACRNYVRNGILKM